MIVYPGILTKETSELVARIERFNTRVDGIHIDFADGKFVPNTLISITDLDVLPSGFFEAHLMVADPYSYFSTCKKLGFSRVLVHLDSLASGSLVEAYQAQNHVHSLGMEFGLVFSRGVAVVNHDLLGKFDHLMIMTIDLGFSGQPFQPDQLEEIKKARSFCESISIAADGHVNDETSPLIAKAGATHLVSTSYLSGELAEERYNQLKGL